MTWKKINQWDRNRSTQTTFENQQRQFRGKISANVSLTTERTHKKKVGPDVDLVLLTEIDVK